MRELKDAINIQHKAFMDNLEEVNGNLVRDCTELREKQHELWDFLSDLKTRSQDQKGELDRLLSRMESAEKKIHKLDQARVDLETSKCEKEDFHINLKRIDETLHKLEENVQSTENHCVALDNFMNKYQPVRVQTMIGETLDACLTGEERRNHELYENDKISLLYRIVLEDSGAGGDIQKLIIRLNEDAKYAIEDEERKKRRNAPPVDEQADMESDDSDNDGA